MIFGDIRDCLQELETSKNTPVKVRREFARFITLTQQLTEVMRKEFKGITNNDWIASSFEGWNAITDLFKKLRRTDYHESPVIINVRERQHYLAAILEDDVGNEHKAYMTVSTTWGLGDPFSTKLPGDMKVIMYDENMNPLEDEEPEFVEYEYILHPRTEEILRAIEKIGQDNIHILCKEAFSIIEKYNEFYRKQLKKHWK